MIAQNSPEYKKWIALLETNPPKARCVLELPLTEKRCCLGHCCYVNKSLLDYKPAVGYYNDCDTGLPEKLCKILNIDNSGEFTLAGSLEARTFLDEKMINIKGKPAINSLVDLNDNLDIDHATIAEIIKHLAAIEANKGIEMFEIDPDL